MINPQLLTKEAGFEDGVVVETVERGNREFNIFRRIFPVEGTTLWAIEFASGWCPVVGLFDVIRPLTGPMSIWNHAPQWATFCRTMKEDREGDTIFWYGELHSHDQEILRKATDTTERPFWARSGV